MDAGGYTSSNELKEIANRYGIKLDGIYARDLYDGSNNAIINLDDSKNKGSHWVCVHKNIYFDSYGLPPPLEILKFKPKIKYNKKQIQAMDSDYCGQYCLYFLWCMQNGMSLNEFKKLFSYDSKNNLRILKELFK